MENVKNYRDIKLVKTERKKKYLAIILLAIETKKLKYYWISLIISDYEY